MGWSQRFYYTVRGLMNKASRQADHHHSLDLFHKSNFNDTQQYRDVDLSIAADTEATLRSDRSLQEARDARQAPAWQARAAKMLDLQRAGFDKARVDASYGWDVSPISTRGFRWSLLADQERDCRWSPRPIGFRTAAAPVDFKNHTIHRRRGRRRRATRLRRDRRGAGQSQARAADRFRSNPTATS